MSRRHINVTAIAALAIASFVACADPGSTSVASSAGASLDRAGYDQAGAHRQYGTPQRVGNGTVRTYIVRDQKEAGREWAESFEATVEAHREGAERFEIAQLCAEVGIVLSSIAMLYRSR